MLKKYPELFKAASDAYGQASSEAEKLTSGVFAPVAVMYTLWILSRAEEMGIKRLYFLARDGYTMYHTALALCERFGIDIECSYFYCSRCALRMAAYRFFDDSAFDKLFLYSYRVSPYIMLKRAGFNKTERQSVYRSIGFEGDEKELMNRAVFHSFREKVRSDEVFRDILMEKSDSAYESFEAYAKQEKLGAYDRIGIVDLGWTGSMQYTLMGLLKSMDIRTEVTGFYMGMLNTPPKEISCETWLFGSKARSVKAWFSHNLVECVFSAPHGQTMGYEQTAEGTKPVFAEKDTADSTAFIRSNEHFAVNIAQHIKNKNYYEEYRKLALSLLKAVMMYPDKKETDALGVICFCDDVGEQYHKSIAEKGVSDKLRKELILHKFFNRDNTDGYYWYYGSLEAGDVWFKPYYRQGYRMTRYILSCIADLTAN